MAYCTKDEVIDRYGSKEILELADLTKTNDINNAVVIARVNRAIAAAGARIDSYLMKCYKVPLAYTPPLIKECCIEVTRYMMYDKIRLTTKDGSEDHESRRNYTDWLKWLKEVCDTSRLAGPNDEVLAYPSGSIGIAVADRPGPVQVPCCGGSTILPAFDTEDDGCCP